MQEENRMPAKRPGYISLPEPQVTALGRYRGRHSGKAVKGVMLGPVLWLDGPDQAAFSGVVDDSRLPALGGALHEL